ncbi:MAG: hypothetical protein J6P21_02420 [Clostridia bacterium]|nr:hypothetical protein [Clostridia bacterium]
MFGKKFCAALCTSLALSSAAPKADAGKGAAVYGCIAGGLQTLIGTAETVLGILGFTGALDDKLAIDDILRKTRRDAKLIVRVTMPLRRLRTWNTKYTFRNE